MPGIYGADGGKGRNDQGLVNLVEGGVHVDSIPLRALLCFDKWGGICLSHLACKANPEKVDRSRFCNSFTALSPQFLYS